jgi:hypothetical protein
MSHVPVDQSSIILGEQPMAASTLAEQYSYEYIHIKKAPSPRCFVLASALYISPLTYNLTSLLLGFLL